MALAAAPFAAQAETWNIYGWQNHSWEFVDIDGGQSFDRIQSNAGNIGFAASVDTGMNGIHVNVQCEQFMYVNHYGGGTGWCNRNSKIGLSHPEMGEIMFATWLLPYNEGVAQWVDPFYDAGADSHTSIMGSVGATTIFYNTGEFNGQGDWLDNVRFNYSAVNYDMGFNRRQENIIQYWSPNWNGFVFRFAWTAGVRDETAASVGDGELDPVIRSSSLAYTNGPLWLAVTWQDHEDWTAASVGEMESSDAESFRVAGRYIMDLGDGMSLQLSAMWENLEYEFNGVTSVDAAMSAFGYGNFASSYTLRDDKGDPIMKAMRDTVTRDTVTPSMVAYSDDSVLEAVWKDAFTNAAGKAFVDADPIPTSIYYTEAADGTITWTAADQSSDNAYTRVDAILTPAKAAVENDPLTGADETTAAEPGNEATYNPAKFYEGLQAVADLDGTSDADEELYETVLAKVKKAAEAHAMMTNTSADKAANDAADTKYAEAKEMADDEYMELIMPYLPDDYKDLEGEKKANAEEAAAKLAGRKGAAGNVKIERDAWMVSGKIKFGGPVDFRFSYMDADDLEVSCMACRGDWDETAADAWNVGVFYTMPAGTELRLTYSEVNNDDQGTYGQGISGTGLGAAGSEVEMFAVGIVHWFD